MSPVLHPTPLRSEELSAFLCAVLSVSGNCADDAYLLPSREWIEGPFSDAWRTFKESLGGWSEDDNDCDDFARCAAFFAQLLHHNTSGRPQKTALAFGEFWFTRQDGSGHAINLFLYRKDEVLHLGFYEPQLAQMSTLSFEETQSCGFWRV